MNDEDELLAAELAFGLLAAEDRRAVSVREATDPVFAASVDRWRTHAAGLAIGYSEAPSHTVWQGIIARLPANDPALVSSKRKWRSVALAASFLLVVMTVITFERRPTALTTVEIAAQPLVAILRGQESKSVVAVQFDPAQRRLTLIADALNPGHRAAELWVIPADGKPRSLGLIDVKSPQSRLSSGAATAQIAPGVILAISIEPLGGSPTGQPTGPVVITGIVRKT